MQPFRASGLIVLVACIIAAVLAVLLLLTDSAISVGDALGWVFVVLAVYLASLLVP